jgi:hypothetical protein
MTTEVADSLRRLKESFLWAAAQGGNKEDCASLIGKYPFLHHSAILIFHFFIITHLLL